MTEQFTYGNHILVVTDRPDDKPSLAYVTDRNGKTERMSLLDARRLRERLLERLEVLNVVLKILERVDT